MGTLQDLLKQHIEKLVVDDALSEEKLTGLMSGAIKTTAPKIADTVLLAMKRDAAPNIAERRAMHAGFKERNLERWKAGLDCFEILLAVAEEIAEEFNEEHRPEAVKEQNFKFEAVVSLHAKALLIARELICLLEGGYADGALARWRSLHEVAVTANFIAEQNNETAERFLISWRAQAFKAMLQYQKFVEKTGERPFTEDELAGAKKDYDQIITRFGESMRHQYGWASEALSDKKPTFDRLERSVKFDHFRPYYGWASQHVHPNFVPPERLLGLSENKNSELIFLIGPSNSGLADPAIHAARSLLQATAALGVSSYSTFDFIVEMHIMAKLSHDVESAFLFCAQKTESDVRKQGSIP